jgi:hypothetical protein
MGPVVEWYHQGHGSRKEPCTFRPHPEEEGGEGVEAYPP